MPPRRSPNRIAKVNKDYNLRRWKKSSASPSEATKQLQYPPLREEADSIRLLRVDASSTPEDDLICTLYDTTLTECTGYFTACSYEWGPPEQTTTITVNDRKVTIRRNLDSLLRTARFRSKTRTFWIDALCINQNDLSERSRQVKLMGDIYSSAERVWAWLGPGSEQIDYLFHSANKNTLTGRLAPPAEGEELELLQDGFHDFDSRTYWTRLWIVQELVLAKQIDFLSGKYIIPWEALQGTRKRCEKSISSSRQPVAGFGVYTSLHHIEEHRKHPKVRSLEILFYDFKDLHCAVNFDKIFALVGMITNSDEQEQLRHIVDYQISPHDLLARLLQCTTQMLPLDYLQMLSSQLDIDLKKMFAQQQSLFECPTLSLSLKVADEIWNAKAKSRKRLNHKHQMAHMLLGSAYFPIYIDLLDTEVAKVDDELYALGGYHFKTPQIVIRREKRSDPPQMIGFALEVAAYECTTDVKWLEWRSLLTAFAERSSVSGDQTLLLQVDSDILLRIASWLLNDLERTRSISEEQCHALMSMP